ncbi:CDP-diacylglycerol--glycerol-3-phosphate 3-phosphatidyltransferase [Candidatus Woesearchaeota archaeon]|nr:CDP-diacylglycerol--glycerol-3-phosphate 3-phosphatidyltransferase [Candidatus Woesearchaeota archaeon]
MQFKSNIPNKITIIRIGLIPLFAVILLADILYKNILSAFIFGLLSVSDFLDGYFARKKKQVTEFGKLIDPIADKLLISTALIFLIGKGVELWMAVAIIVREIIITAIRIYLLPSRIVVPASTFGKAKTVVQSIAIVFVLLKLPFSWYAMLGAVFLTLVSGLEYLIRIRQMTGNKVINTPNIITLTRFVLIAPFGYYLLSSKIQISLFIFAIITLTDKLDGISARLMNQKTELGSALDSFTDWTLIIATFILFIIKNYIDASWFVFLVVPSLISGALKVAYAKRTKIVPVTFISRVSVSLTYITIISILISFGYNVNFGYSFYLMIATLVMVYLTMIGYIFKFLRLPKKTLKKTAIA